VTVALAPLDARGADREPLVDFLTGQDWPFHVRTRPTRDQIEAAIGDGAFDDEDHAAFWVLADGARIGLAVLEDLTDDAPLFDLRLGQEHRGRGHGVPALRALTRHVFDTWPAVHRFEGQTRVDNVGMRRVFARAGFVKEAHYREGWPVADGPPLASVGYAVLRGDWERGTTTPVDWDDEPR
jgi:RimJ/RimL family protein N-acetyltransferase